MRSKTSRSALFLTALLALTACEDPLYTLSGTVTGLAGSGLVLSNDGVPLALDANGPFVLVGSFAPGTEYAITVTTQPSAPAQVCTVTRGAGVLRSDVTDVEVSCVTTPLAVTGSTPADGATSVATDVAPSLTFSVALDDATVATHVSLTRGTHLVPATVSATADDVVTVTPSERLSLLGRYTVTANTGLLGSYGEPLASSSSFSFTTRDGAWHAPSPVQSGAPNAQDPAVVFLSDGSALAVWIQYDTGVANVWANRYVDGTGWGTPEKIELIDTGNASNVRIAADAQGHAFAVWSQSSPTRTDVFGNRYTVGSGWGGGAVISTGGVGASNYSPAVGVNDAGDVVIAWSSTIAGDDSLWARSYPASGAAGNATRIETLTGNASYPKLVMDDSGHATVVFLNADSSLGTADFWAARFDGSTWGAPVSLESSTLSLSEYSVAIDGSGRVFAAFSQQLTPSSMGVYVTRFDTANGWSPAVTLDTTSNSSAYYPEVAADADGNALVLWGQYAASTLVESSSYFTIAEGWSPKEVMPASVGARPRFDANGNAMTIWRDEVSPTNRVARASRFTPTGGWASPVTVTPGPGAYAESATLAVDARGGALAVFIAYDIGNNREDIASARFDDQP